MQARKVSVFGAGYVGLVAGACLAESGHDVTVLDLDERKLASLRAGKTPFFEPGLDELLISGMQGNRLRFMHPDEPAELGEFVFVAVGTPSTSTGSSDLRYVNAVVDRLVATAPEGTVVIMKSTVPPGTGAMLARRLEPKGISYASNPEFLREGSAVNDWFKTDRVVIGGDSDAATRVGGLYEDIDAPILVMDIASAELVKYASNAFLAMKISFANEMANLCDRIGADVNVVMDGVGRDARIGRDFLKAGIGYGGSCFPKDTRALDYLYSVNGHHSQLLRAVIDVNTLQRRLPLSAIKQRLGDLDGRKIAVLGLSFKPNTDDTRESPAEDIISMLLVEGVQVSSYDPIGTMTFDSDGYAQVDTLAEAVAGASAAVVCTEWSEIASADWKALCDSMSAEKIVFDGRNCLSSKDVAAGGGVYIGVGCR